MRKLDTSSASTSVSQPLKAGSVQHLQLAYQEALNALALNLIGPTYQTNVVYVLFGCVNSGSGSTFNMSAGAVFYNGEIFLVDATTFTLTGSNVPLSNIVTSYFVDASADPTIFSDASSHNVHQIRKVVISQGVSGSSTLGDFSTFLQTQLVLVNDQEATLGATYTVNFKQDKAVFFASATVNSTINFDFTNAVPGAVVRLQWTFGAGLTLTITPGSGAIAYIEGGDISRVAGHTNSMYLTYVGKDSAGNNVVGYSISQIA